MNQTDVLWQIIVRRPVVLLVQFCYNLTLFITLKATNGTDANQLTVSAFNFCYLTAITLVSDPMTLSFSSGFRYAIRSL